MKNIAKLAVKITNKQEFSNSYSAKFHEYKKGKISTAIKKIAEEEIEELQSYDSSEIFNSAEYIDIQGLENKILKDVQERKNYFDLEDSFKEAIYQDIINFFKRTLEESILLYIYNYLYYVKNIEEIEDDVLDSIIKEIDFTNINQKLEDIIEVINKHVTNTD